MNHETVESIVSIVPKLDAPAKAIESLQWLDIPQLGC
jgi:hypothetical protein